MSLETDGQRDSRMTGGKGGDVQSSPTIPSPRQSQPASPLSLLGVAMCSGFGSPGSEGVSGRSPEEMNSFSCSPYFRTWTLGRGWGQGGDAAGRLKAPVRHDACVK